MGAVSFSLDPNLVSALRTVLDVGTLVETGTFQGATIERFAAEFDSIVSIEMSEKLWRSAADKFKEQAHVKTLLGDSSSILKDLAPSLRQKGVLYWLDAHWCEAENTAGLMSQCPLLEEIAAIESLNSQSVIIIDDARLFLAPPLAPHEISQWPSLQKILEGLLKLSDQHEVMVVNDVIVFYPLVARDAVVSFAQANGIDWLDAANCLKQSGTFLSQLEEKERVIQDQEAAIRSSHAQLKEKDQLLQQMSRDAEDREVVLRLFGFLRPLARFLVKIYRIFKPRLGVLVQYSPRPMELSRESKFPDVVRAPKISIVTPSFNQGGYIGRTIDSVLSQKYPNLEYFVQDGGSRDDTVDVLKAYGERLDGWVSEPDEGQSQAINRGFQHATGDIMAWLNSDDLLLPGALHVVAEFFERNPHIDVVYGNRLMVDENDLEIGRWILPSHDSEVLPWADFVPQETMFWRRSIWEKSGGHIDESFRFAMDWDLILRFKKSGARFAHIPKFLGAFRIHESQKTSAAINAIGYQEMDKLRQRELGFVPDQKTLKKALFKYLFKHMLVDLNWRVKRQFRSGAV